MTKAVSLILTVLVIAVICVSTSYAQTTEFTYQGNLKDGGSPANANYDIEFRLYDAQSGGSLIGSEIYLSPVTVTNGIFSVRLDFGQAGFPGPDRYIEIAVRRSGVGSLVTLGPRQKIGSAPYAVQSLQAATATTAMIASNALSLGGVNAGQYILTTDPRLSDPRNPLAGSSFYIQNTNTPQSASNFNISGTGTANLFNSATGYRFGGNHLISAPGMENLFAGAGAGGLNLGNHNAFFGSNAGLQNKQGSFNAFYGAFAGEQNVTGNNNSFFGYFAGNATTSGSDNSFFGNRSGQVNTSGAYNSFFGTFSGLFNSTGSDNSFFGNEAGFNNNGDRNSFFGSKAGRGNTTGNDNAFLGSFAGRANTTGSGNAFVGSLAGQSNATGINNSFFGANSGYTNTGNGNSFFGMDAGYFTTSGSNNTFLGNNAGKDNTTGELNVFIGVNSGAGNALGRMNTIIGSEANMTNANLSYATAIGAEAIVNTSNTVVLGRPVDTVRVPGNIAILGTLSAATLNINASTITGILGTQNGGTGMANPGAIGNFLRSNGTHWTSSTFTSSDVPSGSTFYIQNSTIQQGSSNFHISGNGTAGGMLTGNAINTVTQYNIGGSRVLSNPGLNNLFVGIASGSANTTGSSNSFFGHSAGLGNTSGTNNSFIGTNAGLNSTGSNNTMIGSSSGLSNTLGGNNTFVGINAGEANTIGGSNTILGANANVGTNNLTYATAVGSDAVVSTSNTVVLGRSVDTVRIPGNLSVFGTLTATTFSVPASSITGVLPVANGGTGMNAVGTAGNYLRSNGSIWQSSAIAASDLPAGSGNYIQNSLAVQAASNFNISGSGMVGGPFSANLVNSATNYQIGGMRVLSNAGTSNIFVGAGTATTGNNNSFFGFGAGAANTTGFSNTLLGSGSNVGAGNLTFATALGAGATVNNNNSVVLGRTADTVRIPGDLVVTGSVTAPSLSVSAGNITGILAAANGGTGISSPGTNGNFLRSNGAGWQSTGLTASDIPSGSTNYIQSGVTPQAGANFNIAGNGTIGGNFTVVGTFSGNVTAGSITGTISPANGGTGLGSPGSSGNFLRSNGTIWTSSSLTASDIPDIGAGYIKNGTSPQATSHFNISGNGVIGGNLTVGGTFSGNVTAGSITGSVSPANGGTGLESPGSSGNFLRSNGTIWTSSSLTASDIPDIGAGYIKNGTSPQAASNFNIAGDGVIGGDLTVGGNISGSFSVAGSNITGTVPASSGGTGLASPGTAGNFLKSTGGGWQSAALTGADIPGGSTGYVQNGLTPQASTNFNISGDGTAGGTITGNAVNAITQYNINGTRVFATTGTSNIFVGPGTGTTGFGNSFFGSNSGVTNSTGANITLIGSNADVGNANLSNSTAIGSQSRVDQNNSIVLGSIAGVNGAPASSNVGIGTTAPKARLEVTGGNILVGSPGQGILLKSPDGTVCRLMSINNSGDMVLTPIACP